jgi:chromosome segregation ATPase
MSDDSSDPRCRRIREALAEWSTICAEGDQAVERLIADGRAAIAEAPVGQTIMIDRNADAGEWSKMIEELESRLAGAAAAECAAREEAKRFETEIQELRRAKRDLERDSRNARHELENLKASLDEDAEEREFARRQLESRVAELEAENQRLLSARSTASEVAVPPLPAQPAVEPEANDDSPVRRALKSLGKKRSS